MKIIIVLDNIHTGGISKSLLNFLPHICKYGECDLLLFRNDNIDETLIPSNVNIIIGDDKLSILGMSQSEIKFKSKTLFLYRSLLVIIARIFGGHFSRRILFRHINDIGEYDLAISYSQDVRWNSISTGCNQFVIEKTKALYKAAFIHCDYEHFGGYDKRQILDYQQFDSIVCVSNSCSSSFAKMFPALSDKCVVCENFTNTEEIYNKLEMGSREYKQNVVTFSTVCRLGEEKGIERAVYVFGRLLSEGYKNFQWIIVGDGPERDNIEQAIKKVGLSNYIELVGKKSNPYYYVKNSDVFLLSSFHEAAPMVFGEAHAMGIPILTTNTVSAYELVENRGLGKVCENSDEGLYNKIKEILSGDVVLERITDSKISEINIYAEHQLASFLQIVKERTNDD